MHTMSNWIVFDLKGFFGLFNIVQFIIYALNTHTHMMLDIYQPKTEKPKTENQSVRKVPKRKWSEWLTDYLDFEINSQYKMQLYENQTKLADCPKIRN